VAVPLVRLAWVSTGFDRCDRHQVLHGTGELPVECDQRVGVELGQCHVLGVKGTGPPGQAGGLPCDVLQDAVPEQPDPQPAHVLELPLGLLPGISPRRTAWYRSDSTCERRSAGARI
jgi:hypothetical protein